MAHVFEDPISAQVEQMSLGPQLLVSLRRLAELQVAAPDTSSLRRRQLERDLDGLARRHARRAITTDAYLAEHSRLTRLIDTALPAAATAPVVEPDVAIRWLRDVRGMWRAMDDEGRRELAGAIYERITVTAEGIVEVEPTQEALRHGIALALPERVVLARPEGLEQRLNIPVAGRRDWLRLLRTA
jgi:hypothetical protein